MGVALAQEARDAMASSAAGDESDHEPAPDPESVFAKLKDLKQDTKQDT
jgi:hypothetical protein